MSGFAVVTGATNGIARVPRSAASTSSGASDESPIANRTVPSG